MTVYAAYFAGRSIEKVKRVTKWLNWKNY
jgi:hypothetical protein